MSGHISHCKVITLNGNTWRVNSTKSGLNTQILKRMVGQFEAVLSHHSKVHLIRLDLHQSCSPCDNKRISIFLSRLIPKLKGVYGLKRIGYFWVREQNKSDYPHYHFIFMLDGHKVQRPSKALVTIVQIWENMCGTASIPKNCYYNIKRDNLETIRDAIWRISYLAKGRDKGKRPSQTKDYSGSRLKFR